jgi:hypothetical protein
MQMQDDHSNSERFNPLEKKTADELRADVKAMKGMNILGSQ